MEHVFKYKEEEDLGDDGLPAGEGHLPRRHAEELGHGVEEPDDGELDGEMAEQDLLRARPLFGGRRDLVGLKLPLAEVGHGIDDDPWDSATEVHDLRARSVSRYVLTRFANAPREAGTKRGRWQLQGCRSRGTTKPTGARAS